MSDEVLLRVLVAVCFLGALVISGTFRRRARREEAISRAAEARGTRAARLSFALALYGSFFAYLINPRWMAWSSLPLPGWLRWAGIAIGLGMLPGVYWVMVSIGSNISETYLTKRGHQLVSRGPYRWIRHPLYTVAFGGLLGLGLAAANWFMLLMVAIAFAAIATLVVPREEAELLGRFGADYVTYQGRTGRFLPRLGPAGKGAFPRA